MPFPMEQVSTDVFACITEHLCSRDLCAMVRVSKAYHSAVQPLLWTIIEMHRPGFHTQTAHNALRIEEATSRMTPPYNTGPRSNQQYQQAQKALIQGEKFLNVFSSGETPGERLVEERKKELGALVRWLCLPTHFTAPNSMARSFAHFVNLEHLEISCYWKPNSGLDESKVQLPALQNLKTLKLRGYFPEEFVRWLLTEPDRIEELHLAVLDRQIGWSDSENAIPEDQIFDYLEEMTEGGRTKVEEVDLEGQEYVTARALACLVPESISRLVSLKTLHLCKPGVGTEYEQRMMYYSTPSDERILREWSALFRATRKTLQHLILDQRPIAEENTGDSNSNKSYMRECANGPSYDRFVRIVLPELLDSEACPELRTIRLFGFERHDEGVDASNNCVNYPNRSVDVPGQLRARFPDAEVSDYAGCRLVMCNWSGELETYGDVLEISNSYDTDDDE